MPVNIDKNEKSPSGGDNRKKFNLNKPEISPSLEPADSKDLGAADSRPNKVSPLISKSNQDAKSKLDFSKEKLESKASGAGVKKSSKLTLVIAATAVVIVGIWFLNKGSKSETIETAQTKSDLENKANTTNPNSSPSISTESKGSVSQANDSLEAQNEPLSESKTLESSTSSSSNNSNPANENKSSTPKKVESSAAGNKTSNQNPSKPVDKKNDSNVKQASAATTAKEPAPVARPNPSTTIAANLSGSIEEKANRVIKGLFGNGGVRRNALGSEYDAIQAKVNELLRSKNQ